MRLVGVALTLARAAAEHLLEEDARLYRPQEHDVFEVGDVHAGRQQVDSDDDAGVGAVAELPDALQRPVDVTGDLGNEGVTSAEAVAGKVDQLVGVRDVRQVVGGEDQGLGEAPELLLVLRGMGLQLFEDLAIGVWRRDLLLDLIGVESPLVLQQVELAHACLRVDLVDLLALLQEDAVHADVRAHPHHVVVDQVALADSPVVLVAEHQVLEVGHGVQGWRGRQAHLDSVEVVEGVAPDGHVPCGVAPVALVGDDQVEGVDGDAELLNVDVNRLVINGQRASAAEQVDRHALDRADVDKGIAELGPGQQ